MAKPFHKLTTTGTEFSVKNEDGVLTIKAVNPKGEAVLNLKIQEELLNKLFGVLMQAEDAELNG